MLFSYVSGGQRIDGNKTCRRINGNTTRGASPDGAHPGLHSKPLDAAIGRVPAPYRPGGRHGRRFRKNTQNTNKTQLLASNYGTFRASCL